MGGGECCPELGRETWGRGPGSPSPICVAWLCHLASLGPEFSSDSSRSVYSGEVEWTGCEGKVIPRVGGKVDGVGRASPPHQARCTGDRKLVLLP